MNRIEKLKELKNKFKKFLFADVYSIKTEDGRTLSVMGSELATGVEIVETKEDGTNVPLEDGDYKLINGQTITVTGGVIKSITEPMPETEAPETEVEVEMCIDKTKMVDEAKVMEMEKRIADLESAISDLTDMMQGTMHNAQKMSEKITQLSEQPASEPVIIQKTIVETKLSDKEDSKQRIFELAKKLKNNNG